MFESYSTEPFVTFKEFASNEEALNILDEITTRALLPNPGIILEPADVKNAGAGTARKDDGSVVGYIAYNPLFIRELITDSGTDWAGIAVLAHEVGHIFLSHFASGDYEDLPREVNHKHELQADAFAARVLYKMGASLEETQSFVKNLRGDEANHSHPARRTRIIGVTAAWDDMKARKEPIQPLGEASNDSTLDPVSRKSTELSKKKGGMPNRSPSEYTDYVWLPPPVNEEFCQRGSCNIYQRLPIQNNSSYTIQLQLEVPAGYFNNCTQSASNFVKTTTGVVNVRILPNSTETPTMEFENVPHNPPGKCFGFRWGSARTKAVFVN